MSKELKKELIAKGALSCFMSKGYNGTSMDDIVKASGVSKGGIYWHFKSKEEIFFYLVEKWIDDWVNGFLSRLKEGDSAQKKLETFVEYYLEKTDAAVPALIHEFVMQTRDENTLKEMFRIHKKEKILVNIFQQGVDNGEFEDVGANTAANIFSSIIHGIGVKWLIEHRDMQFLQQTAKIALSVFLHGILRK